MGKNNNGGKDKNNNGGKEDMEIVFKLNLHCDGCRNKIRKSILSFHGVKEVQFEGDFKLKIVTWMNVDPLQLQKRLQKKTTKTVEILSPLPKKEKDDKRPKSEPKEKETPITTVVLKVSWHCNGCGDRINKAISSYKGVYEVSIDKEKDLVTVKGKMDSKKMVEVMREKLRKPVEIVPEKQKEKEKEKDKKDGGDNKKEDHNKGGGGRKGSKADKFVFGFGTFGLGHMYEDESGQVVAPYYAPQLFSDENPNACSLM